MAMPEDSWPLTPCIRWSAESLAHSTRWLAGLKITVVTEDRGQQECPASAKGPQLSLGFPGKDLGWRTGFEPSPAAQLPLTGWWLKSPGLAFLLLGEEDEEVGLLRGCEIRVPWAGLAWSLHRSPSSTPLTSLQENLRLLATRQVTLSRSPSLCAHPPCKSRV
ncbi:hypothetical protein H1C71_000193 [Ictidomys tridecemlineatus]|nr:hypothetical protein H1C71_000193 [Ictidomys tridecemlineatus]